MKKLMWGALLGSLTTLAWLNFLQSAAWGALCRAYGSAP